MSQNEGAWKKKTANIIMVSGTFRPYTEKSNSLPYMQKWKTPILESKRKRGKKNLKKKLQNGSFVLLKRKKRGGGKKISVASTTQSLNPNQTRSVTQDTDSRQPSIQKSPGVSNPHRTPFDSLYSLVRSPRPSRRIPRHSPVFSFRFVS